MAQKPQAISVDVKKLFDRKLGSYGLKADALSKLGPRLKKIVSEIEKQRKAGEHRYRQLPYDVAMRRSVKQLASRLRKSADNLVVLGIGGSALGNIALQQALNHPQYNLLSRNRRKGPRLFVMDNVDPVTFQAMLDVVGNELPRTIFNVISKSGETAETASQFLIIRDLLRRKLGEKKAQKQIVATTDVHKGTLRTIVDREGYASLPVPDGVGGRFSVLSAVGLFSAAMCGIDIDELLKGAADMDKQVSRTAFKQNPAALLAAVKYLYYQRGHVMHVMMPYSNSLYGFADWYRQLWAESLGKEVVHGKSVKNLGPTPIKALGTTDQHSQVQLYREGPFDKLLMFLEVERFVRDVKIPTRVKDVPALSYLGGSSLSQLINAEKKATELALVASHRPCLTIRFPEVRPYTIGQFIYLMEATTTIMGDLMRLNPYDQPGVELGKQITYHLMGKPGYEKMPK